VVSADGYVTRGWTLQLKFSFSVYISTSRSGTEGLCNLTDSYQYYKLTLRFVSLSGGYFWTADSSDRDGGGNFYYGPDDFSTSKSYPAGYCRCMVGYNFRGDTFVHDTGARGLDV